MANSQASLAIMQADIDKALQQKQQAHAEQASKLSSIDTPSTLQSAEPLLNSVEMADNSVLDEVQLSRVIEMAWEDRTPFAAIEHSYGLNEAAVINLMRQQLKPSSFRLWRQRVTGRNTKHQAKRSFEVGRAYCKTQYKQR
jgi:uncharacterized protein (TIGR03643 family)